MYICKLFLLAGVDVIVKSVLDPSVACVGLVPDTFFCTVTWLPPAPPLIVIVLVAPLPSASTPEPTKFSVVAAVDKELPSSCIVIALLEEPPSSAIINLEVLLSYFNILLFATPVKLTSDKSPIDL